jgi:hypothetical protein
VGGEGADYGKVQEALSSAAAGAVITVEAGTYAESLALSQDATLQGKGAVTICAEPGQPAIHVLAGAEVTLRGLTIDCATGAGVWCDGGRCTLEDSTVTNSVAGAGLEGDGVLGTAGASLRLTAARLTGNQGDGLRAQEVNDVHFLPGAEGAPANLCQANQGAGLRWTGGSDATWEVLSLQARENGQAGVQVDLAAPRADGQRPTLALSGTLIADQGQAVGLSVAGATVVLQGSSITGGALGQQDGARVGAGGKLVVKAGSEVSGHARAGVVLEGAGAALEVAGRVTGNAWGGVWCHAPEGEVVLTDTGLLDGNGVVAVGLTRGKLSAGAATLRGSKAPARSDGKDWDLPVGDGVAVLLDASAQFEGTVL